MVAAKSVLRLSETNCDSKAPNLTLVLKDRSALLPGPDVALLTVLGLAGMPRRSALLFSLLLSISLFTLNDAFLRQLGKLARAGGREVVSRCGMMLADLAQVARISCCREANIEERVLHQNSRALVLV